MPTDPNDGKPGASSVQRLLKVYNVVNDEQKSRFSLKFLAALALFLLSAMAVAGFYLSNPGSTGGGAAAEPEYQTDEVRLSPGEIAQGTADGDALTERWEQWEAAHPDAVVVEKREIRMQPGNVLIGWFIKFHEP